MKYVAGILIVVSLSSLIWIIYPGKGQENPFKDKESILEDKITSLEEQIGFIYRDTVFSLNKTTEQLLAQDFSRPISEADEVIIDELTNELYQIIDILFYSNREMLVQIDLHDRIHDVLWYLRDYQRGTDLTDEEVADLHQALKALYFISADFQDIVNIDDQASYDAMHDKGHEMFERVKFRLNTKY
ncbi:hypothetical protein ACOQFO_05125 [Ureibacillus sp. MALMAid1270]|uniref:hypothetical protein n=1 Tax=Ureibacillus sp. MALMAid1270 TaxID=3411629 RepID=UPI003BA4C05F